MVPGTGGQRLLHRRVDIVGAEGGGDGTGIHDDRRLPRLAVLRDAASQADAGLGNPVYAHPEADTQLRSGETLQLVVGDGERHAAFGGTVEDQGIGTVGRGTAVDADACSGCDARGIEREGGGRGAGPQGTGHHQQCGEAERQRHTGAAEGMVGKESHRHFPLEERIFIELDLMEAAVFQ